MNPHCALVLSVLNQAVRIWLSVEESQDICYITFIFSAREGMFRL